jgi:hypothetical protein
MTFAREVSFRGSVLDPLGIWALQIAAAASTDRSEIFFIRSTILRRVSALLPDA